MPRRAPWTILLACLALLAPATAAAETVPGEVIVRYKSGTSASERAASRSRAGATFKRSLPIARSQLLAVKGSVADAVDRLSRQANVLYAQPNYIYRASAPPPNDLRFPELWGLSNGGQSIEGQAGVAGIDVRALSAWDTTRGAGAVVAVADTGVDLQHPDLAPNLVSAGRDFVDNDNEAQDENDLDRNCLPDPEPTFHGTHVAGTSAAVDGNGIGVAGVAPDARILPVRVLDKCGSGSSAAIAAGISYAANQGADVVNLSLGGPAGPGDDLMSEAIDFANSADVVVVAAAGNEGQNNDETPQYPCAFPQANLICVAAVDNRGNRPSFSNYGFVTVDVGAPGVSILSTQGTDPPAYQYLDGTSMASPHVAGVAALAKRSNPSATDTQVVAAIKRSVRPLASLQGDTATGGLVDAAAAIRALRPPPRVVPPPAPTAPGKASFRRSKRTIRVSRSGRFRFRFSAAAGLGGRITLKTVRKVRSRRGARRRIATFANRSFTVPASGRVSVRFRLSRRNRQILARYKKLRISVRVKLRNAANLTSTARVRITLKAPARRRR